jgi:hypothetical protein
LPKWERLRVVIGNIFYLDGRRVDFDYPIAPVDHISFRSDEDVISMQQEDLFLSRLFRCVAMETQV